MTFAHDPATLKRYRTAAGSIVETSGQHAGRASVDFDWFEEEACMDCHPDPYPDKDGAKLFLTWHCEECEGGRAELIEVT